MKTTELENGMSKIEVNGVEIIVNKMPKISGKKTMYQILQGGHQTPANVCADVKYIPKDVEDFFNQINKNCNLHFGAIIS